MKYKPMNPISFHVQETTNGSTSKGTLPTYRLAQTARQDKSMWVIVGVCGTVLVMSYGPVFEKITGHTGVIALLRTFFSA